MMMFNNTAISEGSMFSHQTYAQLPKTLFEFCRVVSIKNLPKDSYVFKTQETFVCELRA